MATAILLPLEIVGDEATEIAIQVDGLACPFCVYGLEKNLKKVDGIDDVAFDLNSGMAVLSTEEGNFPIHSDVRTAVKRAGFTPGEIKITAVGNILFKESDAFLKLRNSQREYALSKSHTGGTDRSNSAFHDLLIKFADGGTLVVITGTWNEDDNGLGEISVDVVKEIDAETPPRRNDKV